MAEDPLERLDLSADQVVELGSHDRSRLLHFLLRWEYIDSLHACLDALLPLHPALVSLLDLRARAFLAQEQFDGALSTMRRRLDIKSSTTARSLLAQIYLAQGDLQSASHIAESLVAQRPDSATAWQLLSETRLAQGETEAAEDAYRRLRGLRPHSRAYLFGMIGLYEARRDWVTASGYAVQLLQSGSDDAPLPVYYLRSLRAYFQDSDEVNRAADVTGELERRRELEWQELRAALGRSVIETARPLQVPAETEPARPPTSLGRVPVSADERARIAAAARRFFGHTSMLPGQVETIACILRGEDVLCVLPTGGGKSLCYQLPALMADQGTMLVISPLIALMKDQVDSLPDELRHKAVAINSSLDGRELSHCQGRIARGAYRLVYAAPERLRQPPFLHALRRADITRLVVDEAHCVSAWGHDFRPDYLAIDQARQDLGMPPVLAMTATAPPRVRQDILQHLGSPVIARTSSAEGAKERSIRTVIGDVKRSNLRLEVFRARNLDAKLQHLLAICMAETGSGIVYAGSRARCEELALLLRRYGMAADHYHAGLADRARAQDEFMSGRTRVVVATIAFGLGIDKPDIRFILHFDPPGSVEAYYQEAGRAGRDGQPSRCTLMVSPADRGTLTRRLHRDALSADFLRETYRAVKHRLGGASCSAVAREDLQRDLRSDDTRVRVALSLLEEAGLVRRGPDLPRAIVVRLGVAEPSRLPSDLQAFCEAARLRPGQALSLDPLDVARKFGLGPRELEPRLLQWADKGWLAYQSSGRNLLLELLPASADASNQITAVLERYKAIQNQRVDELLSYARTRRCRHAHISAYLGAPSNERCSACDNCAQEQPLPAPGLPDLQQQCAIILRCVADGPWSWGRQTLVRILRGHAEEGPGRRALHPRARDSPGFGALAFRSRTAIAHLLAELEEAGFLRARLLEDRKRTVIDLTPAGLAALQHPSALEPLGRPRVEPVSRDRAAGPEGDPDEALFEALRAWRLEEARSHEVPPYVVFHDTVLRAIAAQQPRTLEALDEIKGIGPAKLERYGETLIRLVSPHLRNAPGDASP
jgi:ATP-dependent DNA helicase RecQ